MFDPPKTAPRSRPGSKSGGKVGITAPKGKSAAAVRAEGRRRKKLHDQRYYEEVKPGTREEIVDQETNVRILVERQRDGLYHWLIESLDGMQMCEGVHNPLTDFTAEICEDKTSDIALRELEEEVKIVKKKAEKKPSISQPVRREIIVIVKDDWLTKISNKRWKTFDWHLYLRPTQRTLDRRNADGEAWDPNMIYPGDTFEVIAS